MSITDVIMTSKKRRDILILLLEGSKTNEELQTLLDTDKILLKRPIRELKEEGFVTQVHESYNLSNIGKIMIEATLPLLNVTNIFEKDVHYWKTRDLNVIPEEFIERIGEITDYELVKLDVSEMFVPFNNYLNRCSNSSSLKALLTIVEPGTPKIILEFAENGSNVLLVLTKDYFEKIKQVCHVELNRLLELKNVTIDILENDFKPPQIMLCDDELSIILFNEFNKYDFMEIKSSSENTNKWGEGLLMCYKDMSNPLLEV